MSITLSTLIERQKVIVCVGAGGVGKTTLSAAIGVAAAQAGRRPLVLTVDPARRLANALGLAAFSEQVQRISIADFAAQGCPIEQPLDAVMLDVKRTFDRVVARYARSEESRDIILNHPFYRQASTALAGSQEYMACERLYECATSGEYDLVVLDTPPSVHALDFLDAPGRLVDLFDSPAFRMLLKPPGRVRSGMFRTGSVVMRGLSKFTSVEMFGNLLEFFSHLSETFDGFVARAREVQALLASPQTSFVLVAACDGPSTEQALFLGEHLQQHQMEVGAFVVNRVAPFATSPASAGPELERDLNAWLQHRGASAFDDARERQRAARAMALVARQLAAMSRDDADHLKRVRERIGAGATLVPVARREDEPDSLAALCDLAETLRRGHLDGASGPKQQASMEL